ncbi:glycerophosphodiester phosphodiesterase [Haloferula chungangensis]|uniref:Glycerophosphodiester phosphodiesterase n=1 Tax=Haloferula chungangensis TaxID=1048331 RepID=A0ABW2L6J4_9BACT
MRFFLYSSLIASLLSSSLACGSEWNVRDHIKLEDFVIQSHRGAGNLAPENSRETFDLAWSLGTIPEADLRTTKDGVIVAFHDKDFSRILPRASAEMKKKGVEDLTWKEVAALDIGAWKGPEFEGQRIPRIEEMFAQMNGKPGSRVYVDIKNVDLTQLARQSKEAKVDDRLILASTDYTLIREWKKLAPKSKTLHWMGGPEATLSKRLDALAVEGFEGIDQLQIHVKPTKDGFEPSPEFLRQTGITLRAHDILFQTLPWQSRDESLFYQLMDLGVASFATDFPDFTAKTVQRYYHKQ